MLPQHRAGNGRRPNGSSGVTAWASLLILIFIIALVWEFSVLSTAHGSSESGVSPLATIEARLEDQITQSMAAQRSELEVELQQELQRERHLTDHHESAAINKLRSQLEEANLRARELEVTLRTSLWPTFGTCPDQIAL